MATSYQINLGEVAEEENDDSDDEEEKNYQVNMMNILSQRKRIQHVPMFFLPKQEKLGTE